MGKAITQFPDQPPVTLTPELRAAIKRLTVICDEIRTDFTAKLEVMEAAAAQLNEAVEVAATADTKAPVWKSRLSKPEVIIYDEADDLPRQ